MHLHPRISCAFDSRVDQQSCGIGHFVKRTTEDASERAHRVQARFRHTALVERDADPRDARTIGKLLLGETESLTLGTNQLRERHHPDYKIQIIKGKGELMFSCDPCDRFGTDEVVKPSATRLRAMRKARGMTQAALARAAGVTGQSVSNHETGKPMSLEALHAYARALGCRPEELSEPEAGERPGRAVRAVQPPVYPLPIMEFLRLRSALQITAEEVDELTRYVNDGGASDPENLEVALLSKRMSSGAASESEINAFLELTNRKRVARGLAPLRLTPEPPPPRQATRAGVPTKKSRA